MTEAISLNQSLKKSFIDKHYNANKNYQAALLTNDKKEGKKFLSALLKELNGCDEFYISVAFVTNSGVATIASYSLKPLTVKVKNVMVMNVCMQRSPSKAMTLAYTWLEALKRNMASNAVATSALKSLPTPIITS